MYDNYCISLRASLPFCNLEVNMKSQNHRIANRRKDIIASLMLWTGIFTLLIWSYIMLKEYELLIRVVGTGSFMVISLPIIINFYKGEKK